MNPLKRGLGVGMLAWMLMLVAPALAQSDVEKRARERGQAVVLEAFGLLSSNLTAALNRGGVSNALQFCSVQATPLTASIAGTNAFTVRRLSHRARNPLNKAGAAELAILDDFRASLALGKPALPKVHTNELGGATFFAPIVLNNPLCLSCHGRPGQDIKPPDLALLQKLYPNDEATGFTIGELRGLWRVDFQAEALPAPTKRPQ